MTPTGQRGSKLVVPKKPVYWKVRKHGEVRCDEADGDRRGIVGLSSTALSPPDRLKRHQEKVEHCFRRQTSDGSTMPLTQP